jgi:pyruvate dehydrogenase E2 component (dihydrolipoamide acetyltransferase)
MTTALRSPDRVRSLTLIASAGLGSEIDAEYVRVSPVRTAGGTQGSDQPFVRANEELVTRKLVDDLLKFECLDGVPNALEAIASAFLDGDRQRLYWRRRSPSSASRSESSGARRIVLS